MQVIYFLSSIFKSFRAVSDHLEKAKLTERRSGGGGGRPKEMDLTKIASHHQSLNLYSFSIASAIDVFYSQTFVVILSF